jgi:hypothetical protein
MVPPVPKEFQVYRYSLWMGTMGKTECPVLRVPKVQREQVVLALKVLLEFQYL